METRREPKGGKRKQRGGSDACFAAEQEAGCRVPPLPFRPPRYRPGAVLGPPLGAERGGVGGVSRLGPARHGRSGRGVRRPSKWGCGIAGGGMSRSASLHLAGRISAKSPLSDSFSPRILNGAFLAAFAGGGPSGRARRSCVAVQLPCKARCCCTGFTSGLAKLLPA